MVLLALSVTGEAFGWDELGPEGAPTGHSRSAAATFGPATPDWSRSSLETVPLDLGYVARGTAAELRDQRAKGTPLATVGMFAELGLTLDDVLDTLDLIDRTATEDRGEFHQRLEDPVWVAAHFDLYRWTSDVDGARARKVDLTPDQIRLTHYLVYQSPGASARADGYDTALYDLPADEPREDPAPDKAGSPNLLRFAYTRQDVYGGVFEAGGAAAGKAKPLVWLSRRDANRALMQGSVQVVDPPGPPQMYNVWRNNAIPYDPAQKDGNLQARFWYFRPVVGILGVEQIPLRANAAVAGDIWNIGLGKVLALEWEGPYGPEVHLVVLADTGGAFQPNLFQLDWLAGAFPSAEAFAEWEKTMPARAHAAVLVRKRPTEGGP